MADGNTNPPPVNIDGISRPERRVTIHRNWPELKRLFFAAPDYSSIYTWLADEMRWTPKELTSGYTKKMIVGWSAEKAQLEHRKTEAAISEMLDQQRKRIPSLMAAKLNLVAKVMGSVGKWDGLLPADKKLIYEILKTELGEPTKITNLGIGPAPKDPVEALLEEYGLMKDGRVIIDAEASTGTAAEPVESRSVDAPAAAVDSGPPAEIPQG